MSTIGKIYSPGHAPETFLDIVIDNDQIPFEIAKLLRGLPINGPYGPDRSSRNSCSERGNWHYELCVGFLAENHRDYPEKLSEWRAVMAEFLCTHGHRFEITEGARRNLRRMVPGTTIPRGALRGTYLPPPPSPPTDRYGSPRPWGVIEGENDDGQSEYTLTHYYTGERVVVTYAGCGDEPFGDVYVWECQCRADDLCEHINAVTEWLEYGPADADPEWVRNPLIV